jgi:ATP-dependent Lon protease
MTGTETPLRDDVLLVMPVRNVVVFPGAVTQVAIGREGSIAAVREAVARDRKIGILLQQDGSVDEPGPDDMRGIGTIASVVQFLTAPNGMHYLICQGEQRFRVIDFVPSLPFLAAHLDAIPETTDDSPEIEALATHVRAQAAKALEFIPEAPPTLASSLQLVESPGVLADLIAGLLDFKPDEKQTVLEDIEI